MAVHSVPDPIEELEQDLEVEEDHDGPAHHPSAPPDELFDISTTVDPSYIISLIRKLLPASTSNIHNSHGVDACDASDQRSISDHMEESVVFLSGEQLLNSSGDKHESMEIIDSSIQFSDQDGEDDGIQPRTENTGILSGEDSWEEHGCVLWDLAASKTHAELMVQNLILEVLLANLTISHSLRVTEICLGIIGNLACHGDPMKRIVSTNGLIEIIVDQLFLDDAQCLNEVCRLLTVGLQGSGYIAWAEALQSEQILSRILWVCENTLNPQLIEKSIGLLLAISESQHGVLHVLPPLMKLGLSSLLINLLAYEMGKLTSERVPDRYSILDVILRSIEALSVIDGHSREICSNKELFQLVCELVKMPDKVEVSSSCVTAAILIANILSDTPDLTFEIVQDFPFLQGLLDIFSFTSEDLETRNAVWSIIGRILVRVEEKELSRSTLLQYVSLLVSKSDIIEDDLLEHQLEESCIERESLTTSRAKANARTISIQRIICILNQWTASKDQTEENGKMGEDQVKDADVDRLLGCCHRHARTIGESI